MSNKQKRTREQNIKAVKRSIKKWGDSDGTRKKALAELKEGAK